MCAPPPPLDYPFWIRPWDECLYKPNIGNQRVKWRLAEMVTSVVTDSHRPALGPHDSTTLCRPQVLLPLHSTQLVEPGGHGSGSLGLSSLADYISAATASDATLHIIPWTTKAVMPGQNSATSTCLPYRWPSAESRRIGPTTVDLCGLYVTAGLLLCQGLYPLSPSSSFFSPSISRSQLWSFGNNIGLHH